MQLSEFKLMSFKTQFAGWLLLKIQATFNYYVYYKPTTTTW